MRKQITTLLRRGMVLCLTTALTAGAMAQSWVDVTNTYIVNPSYEDGTTGWTEGTAVPVVNATYQNAEFYNKKNSALQTITGLQAGKYKLTVQAFFRPQGNNQTEIDKHKNGTEVIEGYVVAGDSAVKIKSLFSEPNNATVNALNGYPNGMEGFNAYTTAYPESYMNEVYFTITDQTTIKIGIDVRAGSGNRWACWDNFHLYVEGSEFDAFAVKQTKMQLLTDSLKSLGVAAYTEMQAIVDQYSGYNADTPAADIQAAEVVIAEKMGYLTTLIAQAAKLRSAIDAATEADNKYGATLPTAVREVLTEGITAAEAVMQLATLAEFTTAADQAVTDMQNATKKITDFVALSYPLNKAKELADRIGGLGDTEAYAAVVASLANAELGFDEMALNVAQLNAVMREKMTVAFLSSATDENPIDMTSFIVNPNIYQNGPMTANPGGWICVRDGRDGDARTTSEYGESDLYTYGWTGSLIISSHYHQKIGGNEEGAVKLPAGLYNLEAATCCNNGNTNTHLWATPDSVNFKTVDFSANTEAEYEALREQMGTNTLIEGIEVGPDGMLYIGINVTASSGNGKWFRADNFRLYYVNADVIKAYQDRLASRLETAQPLHEKLTEYGIDDADYLGMALDEEEGYKAFIEEGTVEELQQAIEDMDVLIAAAEQIIANYDALSPLLEGCTAIATQLDEGLIFAQPGIIGTFKDALETAAANAENLTWDNYLTEKLVTDTEALAAESAKINASIALCFTMGKAKLLADRIGGLSTDPAYTAVAEALINDHLEKIDAELNTAALNALIAEALATAQISDIATNPLDMTSFIVNPNIYQDHLEAEQPSAIVLPGWETTTNADKPERTGSASGDTWMFCYSWSGHEGHNIASATDYRQTIGNLGDEEGKIALPKGYYQATAATYASAGAGNLRLYTMSRNAKKQTLTDVSGNDSIVYTYSDTLYVDSTFNADLDVWNIAQRELGTTTETGAILIENGHMVIGIRGTGIVGGNGRFWHADNFRLFYYGTTKPEDAEPQPDGIQTAEKENSPAGIYDLMGRHYTSKSQLARGIYLVNGKKVIIR